MNAPAIRPVAGDASYQRRAKDCDVMLLLEGTFPYVSGGVSSWVNQIIRGFPEIRFGLCFIGSRPDDYGTPKYALPDNVVHLETHFIHEHLSATQVVRSRGDARASPGPGSPRGGFARRGLSCALEAPCATSRSAS